MALNVTGFNLLIFFDNVSMPIISWNEPMSSIARLKITYSPHNCGLFTLLTINRKILAGMLTRHAVPPENDHGLKRT